MTGSLLSFIVPVRHQDNAVDWDKLTQRLQQTIGSVSAQDHGDWRGIVVVNEGATLPPMPPNWQVVRVTYPPNPLHEQGHADREAFYEAFRLDKGRRTLSGMMAARDSAYFMVVDDDDFVSRRLAGFVSAHRGGLGWDIRTGYLWDGGRVVFLHNDFSNLCGTSFIIRSDLLGLPERIEDAKDDYIRMLGSHGALFDKMRRVGTPLPQLPFAGAVYRIGHAGAHSGSARLMAQIFSKERTLLQSLRRLHRLRPLTPWLKAQFFGSPVSGEPDRKRQKSMA